MCERSEPVRVRRSKYPSLLLLFQTTALRCQPLFIPNSGHVLRFAGSWSAATKKWSLPLAGGKSALACAASHHTGKDIKAALNVMSSLHTHDTHPLDVGINPPKMRCGRITIKKVAHTTLPPDHIHLSMHNCNQLPCNHAATQLNKTKKKERSKNTHKNFL